VQSVIFCLSLFSVFSVFSVYSVVIFLAAITTEYPESTE
jgi:hypothetical protein